jgi:hypothetical protein
MTLPVEMIDRARAIPIESVVADRGVKLRRVGRELVGPCAACGGTDRFAIDSKRAIWNCRGCGKGGDAIALLMHVDGCSFADAVRILAGAVPGEPAHDLRTTNRDAGNDYARDQARKAAWLWDHRQSLEGSIAERYLREVRGYGGQIPPSLGFLPAREGRHPAMVAAFSMIAESEPGVLAEPVDVAAVHLTLLALDGRAKADTTPNKICVGKPAGRPITLSPIGDSLALAVSEGIEDGLSAAWALGMGAWAAGSAGFMPALADAVPNYIGCATIFGHDDPAGRRGARALADRLVARGIEVFLEGV